MTGRRSTRRRTWQSRSRCCAAAPVSLLLVMRPMQPLVRWERKEGRCRPIAQRALRRCEGPHMRVLCSLLTGFYHAASRLKARTLNEVQTDSLYALSPRALLASPVVSVAARPDCSQSRDRSSVETAADLRLFRECWSVVEGLERACASHQADRREKEYWFWKGQPRAVLVCCPRGSLIAVAGVRTLWGCCFHRWHAGDDPEPPTSPKLKTIPRMG